MSHALLKWWLDAYAKSINTGQPAHFAQADLCRNFLLFVTFGISLLIDGPYYLTTHLVAIIVVYICGF